MKILFWDFDGTLAYSKENFWSSIIYECAVKFGYDQEFELIYDKVNEGKLMTWYFQEVSYEDRVNHLWWADFEARLIELLKTCKMTEDAAEKAARSVRGCVLDANNYFLYEDTKWILNRAKEKGYTNIILSNNYPELDEVMEQLGIAKYFDGFVISGQVGFEKPNPGIFEIALRGKDPRECCMIGDNQVADIQGAKEFGLKTILVHRQNPAGCECDFCFETLREIDPII